MGGVTTHSAYRDTNTTERTRRDLNPQPKDFPNQIRVSGFKGPPLCLIELRVLSARGRNRTLYLQLIRLMHSHYATRAWCSRGELNPDSQDSPRLRAFKRLKACAPSPSRSREQSGADGRIRTSTYDLQDRYATITPPSAHTEMEGLEPSSSTLEA